MNSFLQALNKPVDAFKEKNKWIAWGLVSVTILINTVFEPLLRFFSDAIDYKIDMLHLLIISVLGICSYFAICLVIWIVSKCFGSRTKFKVHIDTWGLSYFPTILCSFVVIITEVYYYFFWNSILWGMILSILFVGILLWKSVLFVIYLREIAGLKRGKVIGAFVVIGIFIVLLAMANGYVGLKTPVL